MKNLFWAFLASFIIIGCRSNDETEITPTAESNVTPTSYYGKWKASHIQLNDGNDSPYMTNSKDYYIQFNANNTVEIKSANGIFAGTSVYKKNGTNDSFTVTDNNKDKVIINSWESTKYTGSREMTLNFSNLGGYGYNYNFIVKK